MTRGYFGKAREPVVTITLHGSKARRIEVIIDTGFSGYLCLARRFRRHVRLRRVGREVFEYADGRRAELPVFLGRITFAGRRHEVLVTLTDARDSLIGTSLLRDLRVVLDFRRGIVRLSR